MCSSVVCAKRIGSSKTSVSETMVADEQGRSINMTYTNLGDEWAATGTSRTHPEKGRRCWTLSKGQGLESALATI